MAVLDIARDEDCARVKNGDFVKRGVERYFRGKRHEAKEQKVTTKGDTAWN